MKKTMRALPLVLAILAGCSSEPAKIPLKAGVMKGLTYTTERSEAVNGWLTVKADGAESKQLLQKEERRTFQDEILEVDGSRVLKLRRKVLAWSLKRQAPGEASYAEVPRTMVGKTIILKRTDLGTEYEDAEGIPLGELKAHLLGTFEALLSLPPESVSVGSSWELDGDRIVDVFSDESGSRPFKVRSAMGTGRLDKVEGGLAQITVNVNAIGAFRSLLDVDVLLDLTIHFRIDQGSGYPMSMDAHADGKISGEVDRKGKPAIYIGEFKFDAAA